MRLLSTLAEKVVAFVNTVTFLERRRERRRAKRHERDRAITEVLARQSGDEEKIRVKNGPFSGMVYPFAEAPGSMLAAKILGSYEAEIQPFVEHLCDRTYERVINVGCGEGYYTVGLARRLPQARVWAFDLDERARQLCRAMAQANGVAERVSVKGACRRKHLRERTQQRALVVCDCEGGERKLLQPDRVPGLARCDLLVELHDMDGPKNVTDVILSRFAATHSARLKRHRPRDPETYPALASLSASDREHAVNEFRSRGRRWVLLQSDADAQVEAAGRENGTRKKPSAS